MIKELIEQWIQRRWSVQDENRVCSSCETLKEQLNIANHEKELLLNRILEKPIVQETEPRNPIPVTLPSVKTWKVKQQMLEQADRDRARAMRNIVRSDSPINIPQNSNQLKMNPELTTDEIERELTGTESDK